MKHTQEDGEHNSQSDGQPYPRYLGSSRGLGAFRHFSCVLLVQGTEYATSAHKGDSLISNQAPRGWFKAT